MGNKFSGMVLLLLLIVTHELVIHTEARSCYSRSKHFRGGCYFRNQINNCKIICKQKEKFTTGKCMRTACYCVSKCGSPGGHPSRPPPSGGEGGEGGEGGGDAGGGEGGATLSLKH